MNVAPRTNTAPLKASASPSGSCILAALSLALLLTACPNNTRGPQPRGPNDEARDLAPLAMPCPGIAPYSTAFHREGQTTVTLENGDILVVGGTPLVGNAELYRADLGLFRNVGGWGDRAGSTATLLDDGRIVVLGGVNRDGRPIDFGEIYRPRDGRWFRIALPFEELRYHSATKLSDGRLLVVAEESITVLDPERGRWTEQRDRGRRGHVAVSLGEAGVLIAGGLLEYQGTASAALINGDTIERLPSMPSPLVYAGAARLDDGRIIVAGGAPARQADPTTTVFFFDPTTRQWTPGPALNEPRSLPVITQISETKVLLTGGASGRDRRSGAEILDLETNRWTPDPRVGPNLSWHSADLLPDGRVLVIGGDQTAIYDPESDRWMTRAIGTTDAVRAIDVQDQLLIAAELDFDYEGWSHHGLFLYDARCHALELLPLAGESTELPAFSSGDQLWFPSVRDESVAWRFDLSDGSWEQESWHGHGARHFDLGDGEVMAYTFDDELFFRDPESGAWTEGPARPDDFEAEEILVTSDGSVFFVGYEGALLLDRSTGAFEEVPGPSAVESYALTALAGGRILCSGGYGDGDELQSTEIFDPTTRSWTPGPALTRPRRQHQSVVVDGEIYLVGGTVESIIGELPSSYIERFDLESGGHPLPNLPTGVLDTPPSVIDGELFLTGFYPHRYSLEPPAPLPEPGEVSSDVWNVAHPSCEGSMPPAIEARLIQNMPYGRAGHAMLKLPNNDVLILGGRTDDSDDPRETFILAADGDSFTRSSKLPDRDHRAAFIVVPGTEGDVLALGLGSRFEGAALRDATSGQWKTLEKQPMAGDPGLAPIKGGIYIIGTGARYSWRRASAKRYDAASKSFRDAPAPYAAASAQLTTLADGAVLVTGGDQGRDTILSSAGLYLPQTNTVEKLPPMALPRVDHRATLLPDGRVLITGGKVSNPAPVADDRGMIKVMEIGARARGTKSVEIYDPETKSFTKAAPMHDRRHHHTATLLADGRVLVIGGYEGRDRGPGLDTAEIYDPTTNSWTKVPLGIAMAEQAAVTLPDGDVLVTGGTFRTFETREVLTFDVSEERFHLREFAEYERSVLEQAPDCSVLAFGGARNSITHERAVLRISEEGFSIVGQLAHARSDPTVTRTAEGRLLIVGGNAETSAELYDPERHTSELVAAPLLARRQHTAIGLPDGSVLIAGGTKSRQPSFAEVYNVATNSWSLRAQVESPRVTSASLLGDGSVVIDANSTLRRLDPSTGQWTTLIRPELRPIGSLDLLPDGRLLAVATNGTAQTNAGGWRPIEPRWGRHRHDTVWIPQRGIAIVSGVYAITLRGETIEPEADQNTPSVVYLPDDNRWLEATNNPRRVNSGAFVIGDQLFVAGGTLPMSEDDALQPLSPVTFASSHP